MRFEPSFLDEIRDRLSVSDVVSRHVKLRKTGREFTGLSPFNAEKTPSFTVNDEKGFYHCFSSGAHGDIFRFLMEVEGLSFAEAVEKLATDAGLQLPQVNPQAAAKAARARALHDVCEAAAKWFTQSLYSSEGLIARNYCEQRGLARETLDTFGFGFAPADRHAIKSAMAPIGITENEMLEAGLLIKPDDGRPSYARFRNRLIIPIADSKGRIIAFGGRALQPDAQPKYLNSPETPLFNKSATVFNAHRAREAAYQEKSVVVMEGYMDVIAAHQAGIKNCVATLGTAFTPDQINLLWRFAPEPVICFDGDRAGLGAANRAIDRILPVLKGGHSFNFAILPAGKDPDDLIRESGVGALKQRLGAAAPLIEMVWERETAGGQFATPERRAALEKRIDELVNQISDRVVSSHYASGLKRRLRDFFWSIDGKARGTFGAKSPGTARQPLPVRENTHELNLLGLALAFPTLVETNAEEFAEIELSTNRLNELRDIIMTEVAGAPDITADELVKKIPGYLDHEATLTFGPINPETGLRSADNLHQRFKILSYGPDILFLEDNFQTLILGATLNKVRAHLDIEVRSQKPNLEPNEQERVRALKLEAAHLEAIFKERSEALASKRAEIRKKKPKPESF